jgi:hypothetical protein
MKKIYFIEILSIIITISILTISGIADINTSNKTPTITVTNTMYLTKTMPIDTVSNKDAQYFTIILTLVVIILIICAMGYAYKIRKDK